MKILSGFIASRHRGDRSRRKNSRHQLSGGCHRLGIGMLHQDPLDFPPLKLLDNFILGREGRLFPDRRRAAREFRELARQFDFSLDPDAWVDSLTVGERQQLEILRLLWFGARVLILDEPTTGISLPQKEKLFATLKTLAAQGMTVIFVSHKLEDVESLCSQVAVLRQGALVGTAAPPYETKSLVRMMFGKDVALGSRAAAAPGASLLCMSRVALEGAPAAASRHQLPRARRRGRRAAGHGRIGSVDFPVRPAPASTGPVAGRISFAAHDLTGRSHHHFKKLGVAYLPAARLEQGLVPGLSLSEHFVLSEPRRGVFIDKRRAAEVASERILTYNIKGVPSTTVESLSGGNQQRMLLALLGTPLSLILLEHPTRGLDIESTLYIWGKLRERCARGTGIVFISADLDEVLQYSDRIVVFFAGRVSPPLPAEGLSVEELGALIGGKGWERFGTEAAYG